MKKTGIVALRSVLCAVLAWGLAASPGARLRAASAGADGTVVSGTYKGRVLTELFRHRQQQLRLSAGQRAALSAGAARSVRDDIGNIAIIEDSNGVIIQPNFFDLEGQSLTFTPSNGLFSVTPGSAALDASARDLGVRVTLGDDDAEAVALPFSFPFFGEQYSEAFLHSDGNLTFEEPEASTQSRTFSRAVTGPPRIAPFFSDLDPSRPGSTVSVYTSATRVVFTWDKVPHYGQTGLGAVHTFQAILSDDGAIEFRYERITTDDAVVGVMPGRLRGEPAAADLSSGAQQTTLGALAEIFSPTSDLDIATAAQRFYLNHDDNYDYLVLFNNLSLMAGSNAFAYESNVRNEVLGIGGLLLDNPLLDYGLQFGSRQRLASFLNMGPLSNYPSDPTQKILGLGENNTLSVMGQEAGHRFLAYVQVIDPVSSLPSRELLGRDFAHWSFFYNSEASVVEGNRIEDRGSGVTPRFLTVEAVTHYSPLDQYIMGLRAPEEVPPSFVVVNSSAPFSPSSPPAVGVSFNGERRNIPLDLIVAAEGPRIPESAVSQKRFTFAFALLVRDGTTPSPQEIEKLETIRTQWQAFFEQAVDHRATADTSLTRMLQLSTWPAAGVLQGTEGVGQVEISQARTSDLNVTLSAGSGVIGVPSAVTIPAGSLTASFPIAANAPGVSQLNAATAEPGFDSPHTLVQVRSDGAELSLQVESGDGQSGGTGGLLRQPVVVRVEDGNHLPYSGVDLVFSASDDSVITPATATTDGEGRARVEWRLGSQEGPATLTARLERAPAVLTTAAALVAGGPPRFTAPGVVNAASYLAGPNGEPAALTPGSLQSIFGSDLAGGTAAAQSLPLPLTLGNTTLRINGIAAPLLYISPGQINFQVPFELTGATAEMTIETPVGLSDAVTVAVRALHPGVFFNTATGVGAVLNADNTPLDQNPARPGEAIQIFVTGLGAVEPAGRTGAAAAAEPHSLTLSTPRVTIGGIDAEVGFSGLAPFYAGLYQVNATVPAALAPGQYPLRIEIEGVPSNEVLIPVE